MTEKSELRAIKKEARRAQHQAAREREKIELADMKAERKAKEAKFKASIKDGYVTDEKGNRIRRYSLPEKILDNKPLSYSITAVFVLIVVIAFLLTVTNNGFFGVG
ncbi:MAG: hypothetical protein LBG81_07785 [Coriobacteriaceae bacterium]|jgi:hypothetical protein|nr:hypothetical protein [Coriobacteriaceae bacterium]